MKNSAHSQVGAEKQYRDLRSAAQPFGVLALANLLTDQAEQPGCKKPSDEENQYPDVEIRGEIPSERAHAERPEQLHSLAA